MSWTADVVGRLESNCGHGMTAYRRRAVARQQGVDREQPEGRPVWEVEPSHHDRILATKRQIGCVPRHARNLEHQRKNCWFKVRLAPVTGIGSAGPDIHRRLLSSCTNEQRRNAGYRNTGRRSSTPSPSARTSSTSPASSITGDRRQRLQHRRLQLRRAGQHQ